MNPTNAILLTIDVEDWFQVENFKQYIPFSSWPSHKLRVEKNTHRILNLLDSYSLEQAEGLRRRRIVLDHFHPESDPDKKKSNKSWKSCLTKTNSPKATFFVLGWIAERLPHLVREIHSRGHEVASHGYCHNLCIECSPKDLRTDLINSKNLLEDIIGDRVYGFRAASFSINNNILKIIEGCGYLYDSSYNSFALDGRHGQLDLSHNNKNGVAANISDTFYELPISNVKLMKVVLPWGGGGYFRLIPFSLFKIGIEFILRKENDYLLYLHPWEIDYDQPRVNGSSLFYKFRHYVNLSKTHSKLSKLIENFPHCSFITCTQYIDEVRK